MSFRLLIAACCCLSFSSALTVGKSAATPDEERQVVQRLRSKIATALKAGALKGSYILDEEAHRVDTDGARLLSSNVTINQTDLAAFVSEYKDFVGHLVQRGEVVQQSVADTGSHVTYTAEQLKGAEQLLPNLESRVKTVLAHLQKSEKAMEGDGKAIVDGLEHALSSSDEMLRTRGEAAAVERVMVLHSALGASQDFLAQETKVMDQRQEQLRSEIEQQQVWLLYKMLEQRKKLPMKAQAALLKRRQFAKFQYAQTLLKSHKDKEPLCSQLEAMLPEKLHQQLLQKLHPEGGATDHLAAAGSEGRVHLVTSNMKNMVKSMEQQLTSSRDKLKQVIAAKTVSAQETEQAQKIIAAIDNTLQTVHGSTDLKVQLDAMYAMQGKLATMMGR